VWTDKEKYRELADVLIVSSAVYALAGAYSLWNGEIHLGIMQIITYAPPLAPSPPLTDGDH
jgi:hypothetical protein